MDRNRFDALARLLATTGSRRATLGALLGISILGQDSASLAKRGAGKNRDDDGGGQDVQGEGRPGAKHKAHHQHKQTQRQRRKRRNRQQRRRNDNGGPKQPGGEGGVCCRTTKACAPPEPGSDRAGCDFTGQSFVGQDHHGANFRGIDGLSATFDETDNQGSDFGGACLRRATFRGANLTGTDWNGACLFAVDFTGADLGDGVDALDGAVLCATILPDGTRTDRDCDRSREFDCCLPPPGGGGGGGCPAGTVKLVNGSCAMPCDVFSQNCPSGCACAGGHAIDPDMELCILYPEVFTKQKCRTTADCNPGHVCFLSDECESLCPPPGT